ncbi:MAG: hypothetical protein ACHQ1H_05390 [Nitrososphaerales archaeon]|jgi:hypothetical protein
MATKELSQSADAVRNQLVSYGNQIQEYLSSIDAKVENYKFSVEKTANGLSIDCQFKAMIQGNGRK